MAEMEARAFVRDYVSICPGCKELLSDSALDNGECYDCCSKFRTTQRNYALSAPHIYGAEVNLPDGTTRRVIEAADQWVNGKILSIFGVFAVTDEGIESLYREYFIEKSRIHDDWEIHMNPKNWVNMTDFKAALSHARSVHVNSY